MSTVARCTVGYERTVRHAFDARAGGKAMRVPECASRALRKQTNTRTRPWSLGAGHHARIELADAERARHAAKAKGSASARKQIPRFSRRGRDDYGPAGVGASAAAPIVARRRTSASRSWNASAKKTRITAANADGRIQKFRHWSSVSAGALPRNRL